MTDNIDIYKFGEFSLNPARRELKKAGTVVEIEPRAFDVLVYLVHHRDRAVDKGELQDAIWPGMFVTETALTRAVMKARKAVDDDASQQNRIKTLHGHGYRFIARLNEAPSAPVEFTAPTVKAQAQTEPDSSTGRIKVNLKAVFVTGIAAVMVLVSFWIFLRPAASVVDETRIAVLPLKDNTGNPELSWTSFGLMSYASKIISNDGSLLIVPVGSVIGLADNFGWNGELTNPVNKPLLEKLKQVYAATHVLAMELEPEGTALRMNYSLLTPNGDIQKGTIVGDDGTGLAQGVVQAIYGNMFRKTHLGGKIPLVSRDAFNNEAFARGMDLSVQGRCAEAVKFFRVIIEQEPGLLAPRYEMAACLRILGETEEAEVLLNELIEELKPMGPSAQLAESMMVLGILYNRTGRLDSSDAIYKEALAIAEEIGEHVLKARILQNLSIVHRSKTELDEAGRYLDLAMLAYQDAGIEVVPGHLYSARANLFMSKEELVEADGELDKALQAFRNVGDRRMEAMMLNNTGYLRRRQGRLDEAEAYHLRSLEIREEIGDRVGVGRIYGMLSGVYFAQGLYDQAISAAQSAGEIARGTNDRLFEATSLAQLAAAEKANGDADGARLHYLEARQVFVDIQDHLRVLQTDLKIAELDMSEGRLDNVETLARQVLEDSRKHEIITTEVESLELLGDLAVSKNDIPAAIREYQNALAVLDSASWDSKENAVKTKLANAYMDEGRPDDAAPLIGALAGAPDHVQSLKARARFAYTRNDPDQAVNLMTRAKELAGDKWSESSESRLLEYITGKTP